MQVEHKTEQGTLYFYKVPDNTESVQLVDKESMKSFLLICLTDNLLPTYIGVEEGLTLIGLTSEVTEETAKMVVDSKQESRISLLTGDVTFTGKSLYYFQSEIYDNALDSFKSLMRHLQVYEVNPLTPPVYPKAASCENDYVDSRYEQHQYDKAQENVGKWAVLFKIKDKNEKDN